MIVVKIELWPGGDPGRSIALHTAMIVNDATGTPTRGNYYFTLSKRGGAKVYKKGRVEGFARKRETAWKLLYLVLKEAFEGGIVKNTTEEKLRAALNKINAIRNSIIGTQSINWSAHIYPLVTVLNEAGFDGQGYEEARKEAASFIEQRDRFARAASELWNLRVKPTGTDASGETAEAVKQAREVLGV